MFHEELFQRLGRAQAPAFYGRDRIFLFCILKAPDKNSGACGSSDKLFIYINLPFEHDSDIIHKYPCFISGLVIKFSCITYISGDRINPIFYV